MLEASPNASTAKAKDAKAKDIVHMDKPHQELPIEKRIRSRVTAAELAKHVGVSRSTVSMVMGGRGGNYRVSKKTQDLVRNAAEQLGYRQAPSGAALRRGSSGMVSVILPDFRENWAEGVMRGIHNAFRESQLVPFVTTHNFSRELLEQELLATANRRDSAAIVFPLLGLHAAYQALAEEGTFVVLLGDSPLETDDVPYVAWDSGNAARCVVEHLIERGYQRIAHLSFDYPFKHSQSRFDAYQETLLSHGLLIEDHLVYKPALSREAAEETDRAVDQFFASDSQPPDAIFCLNDGLALPLLEALQKRGIRVPDDVAVAGMGDLPLSGHSKIGLTTVREPLTELGEAAGKLVLASLCDNDVEVENHKVISSSKVLTRPTTVGW